MKNKNKKKKTPEPIAPKDDNKSFFSRYTMAERIIMGIIAVMLIFAIISEIINPGSFRPEFQLM